MMPTTRRDFLRDSALLGAAGMALPSDLLAASPGAGTPASPAADVTASDVVAPAFGSFPLSDPADESAWVKVAAMYRVTDKVTNMEAGYWGLMAQPVLARYHEHIDRMNRDNSYFARREYPALFRGVREKVAAFVGAKPSEIALSRGATEALQALKIGRAHV